jgi:hypothetical protein
MFKIIKVISLSHIFRNTSNLPMLRPLGWQNEFRCMWINNTAFIFRIRISIILQLHHVLYLHPLCELNYQRRIQSNHKSHGELLWVVSENDHFLLEIKRFFSQERDALILGSIKQVLLTKWSNINLDDYYFQVNKTFLVCKRIWILYN